MKNISANLVILDAKAIGLDLDLDSLGKFGNLVLFETTKYKETASRVIDADIIITSKVILDENILSQCKSLKLICVAATGMNNIDHKYCIENNIQVKNVSGYSSDSVAQLTLTFALNFLGSLSQYNNFTRDKKWIKSDTFTHLGFPIENLKGKKWGIVGLGDIGKKVATIALSFGAEIIYYSTSGKNHDDIYSHVDLNLLLKESDIISIHCPLNDKTKDLISSKELSLIKTGGILINVARGGIVNEVDLVQRIKREKLFAGFDVLESEPMLNESPLVELLGREDFILTPHIAWAAKQSRIKLLLGIEENIKQAFYSEL